MNFLFPPEFRTAAIVPRWTIVRTLAHDNVATHSFFVEYYALQIARLVDWHGPLADLMFVAKMHDIEEIITGDQVSPVKREIIDEARAANFISSQMKLRLPLIETQLETIMEAEHAQEIAAIVRVADKVDAALFLINEQRMGNAVLKPLYDDVMENLVLAWHMLGEELHGGEDSTIENDVIAWDKYRALWNNELYPALQAHWRFGGVGIHDHG